MAGVTVRARLLGSVTVSTGGRYLSLGPPRQRAVFATLATHASQPISREELVDAVWGPSAPATAINSIYTYMSRLRHILEPTRPHRGQSDLLLSDGSGYTLQLSPDQVDKQQFETYLGNARQLAQANAPEQAITQLEAALALWRGTAYGGAVGPLVEAERARLDELRLTAMEERAKLLVEVERHTEIVGELFGLVQRYPLRERLRYLLMLCYVRLGRQADALTEYHDLRATLRRELGVEPGDQLQRFYLQILGRRTVPPAFAAPRQPATATPRGNGRLLGTAQLTRDVPDFTGRVGQLARLHELADAAGSAGESGVVVLGGGPGVGKTALAVRFAHALASRFTDGQLQINMRSFAGSSPPMTLYEALDHLLATLGVTPPGTTELDRRCALYRSAAAQRRLLILLDDVRSVEQVRPLLPGASSCLVIVTSRNRLSGLTVRDGARLIEVDVMSDEEAHSLFIRLVGRPLADSEQPATCRLVSACAGLPLAVRIAAAQVNASPAPARTLRELADSDLLARLEVPGDEHSSLRMVYARSIHDLPLEVAQAFRALGRHHEPDFTLSRAATLLGAGADRARRLLAQLIDASLVREPTHNRFQLNRLTFAYARYLATDDRADAVAGAPH